MVAVATLNAVLRSGGVSARSVISWLLLVMYCWAWYQIEGWTYAFHPVVRDANYLICMFMNISENRRGKGKA